ncbi:hypothetical protein EDC18_101496 [Natranaerovirga pectinivora]|uniref:Uncharacterized protein n=1 Tax=Natranaerovirga pectinivora TaxID=682400 RepID=A0A4R3MSI8_9FIRM|nr:hypothetical protein [Natranaerovirga pectinivora]TCT17198.1 hypothetical protein EDC18_101496 [Natranaerovirga pectinivora]
MNCKNCNSTRIEDSIAIGLSAKTGNIGPKSTKILDYVSQMYCDMCLDCGEILRFYIKDDTNRKWIKKPGSFGTK